MKQPKLPIFLHLCVIVPCTLYVICAVAARVMPDNRSPAVDMAAVMKSWNCTKALCCFPGLKYCVSIDKRFKEKKNDGT